MKTRKEFLEAVMKVAASDQQNLCALSYKEFHLMSSLGLPH